MKLIQPHGLLEAYLNHLIVFGHYSNGEFLGFHSNSFGTISKNYPKIYQNTPRQLKIIETNYKSHINSIRLQIPQCNTIESHINHQLRTSNNLELKIILADEIGRYPTEYKVKEWINKNNFTVLHIIKYQSKQ